MRYSRPIVLLAVEILGNKPEVEISSKRTYRSASENSVKDFSVGSGDCDQMTYKMSFSANDYNLGNGKQAVSAKSYKIFMG